MTSISHLPSYILHLLVDKRGLEPHSLPAIWATCVTSYILLLTSYWVFLKNLNFKEHLSLLPHTGTVPLCAPSIDAVLTSIVTVLTLHRVSQPFCDYLTTLSKAPNNVYHYVIHQTSYFSKSGSQEPSPISSHIIRLWKWIMGFFPNFFRLFVSVGASRLSLRPL